MTLHPQELLRKLPKIDRLLDAPEVEPLLERYSRSRVVNALRIELDALRQGILANPEDEFSFSATPFFDAVCNTLEEETESSLRRVINATGVVLHTNLGRAPLSDRALDAVADVARGYSNLEYDLATGKRGTRYVHIERILCDLTGAEAAIVVNNNAAAVMLAVNTLAKDAEVVTSRGELIEIGGSFRIPDVVERSEAELVEVGTTNKTRIDDYKNAITDATRILLKVHPSNYKIVGFTSAAQREEMVALAHERDLVMVEDLGSGTLIDLRDYGLPAETTVQEVVKAGVDITTFSGDKLLGGPQAGIIVGRREYIDAMKKNPLMRALRPDKMTLAALEATLQLYLDEERLEDALPILAMMAAPMEGLENRAQELQNALRDITGVDSEIKMGSSYAGGGSLPEEAISTCLVTVHVEGISPNALVDNLRESTPPIVARIADDTVQLDTRTITDDDCDDIVAAVRRIVA